MQASDFGFSLLNSEIWFSLNSNFLHMKYRFTYDRNLRMKSRSRAANRILRCFSDLFWLFIEYWFVRSLFCDCRESFETITPCNTKFLRSDINPTNSLGNFSIFSASCVVLQKMIQFQAHFLIWFGSYSSHLGPSFMIDRIVSCVRKWKLKSVAQPKKA